MANVCTIAGHPALATGNVMHLCTTATSALVSR